MRVISSLQARLRFLWAFDVRHLVSHRLRLALAVSGIAAGVALGVAVSSLNTSIQATVEDLSLDAASKANIEVRPEVELGLARDVLGKARAVPGVIEAGATVESYTKLRHGRREHRTFLLGMDSAILALAPRAVEPKRLRVADPFGLFLSEELARELGVRPGERVDAATPRGWKTVPVGGVIPTGRARLAAGALVVVQDLVGEPGRIDAIYVRATDPTRVTSRLREVLGGGVLVGPPGLRGDWLRQVVAPLASSISAVALIALFVGGFLVYNTMSMAAAERTREAALLRAVGASRRQMFGLFLAEGALLGLVGSALGLGLGAVLAKALLATRNASLEEILPFEITRVVLRPRDLVAALTVGVLAALTASLLPARRLSRTDPAIALRPAGALEDPVQRMSRATVLVGTFLLAAGLVVGVMAFSTGLGEREFVLLSVLLFLAGVALLLRWVVPALAKLLFGRLSQPASRVPGAVVRFAAGEVIRSPGRTAFTAAATVLALSLVLGFTIGLSSWSNSFRTFSEETLRADLTIRPATSSGQGADVPLESEVARKLAKVPGVNAVGRYRGELATLSGQPVFLSATDIGPHEGEPRRRLLEPYTVLISPAAAREFGYRVGERIEIPTPLGTRNVRIVGEYASPWAIIPSLNFSFEEFSRLWGSDRFDSLYLYLATEAQPKHVRDEILRRFGASLGIAVDTRHEDLSQNLRLIDAIGGLMSSLSLVAIIVAGLGLANTLLISTLERRQEIGVLRAVGMLGRQVRGMVTVEAILVGGLGVLLAWGLGTWLGWTIREILRGQAGIPMPMVFPPSAYATTAILGIAAAALAAVYPAHRAARIQIAEALRYE